MLQVDVLSLLRLPLFCQTSRNSIRMASKVQLDLDHSKLNVGVYNGMAMPQCYETAEEHVPKLKAMEIRDDDIMLCSFPKSGERGERERMCVCLWVGGGGILLFSNPRHREYVSTSFHVSLS